MSTSTRCAACKYLRRRCSEDCILAPYFPSTLPERFACVHKIFGASNVSRMLQQLPVDQRAQAADSIADEAYWRVRDPVYGSVGVISLLQQEIHMNQLELAKTQAQIAMYNSAPPQQIQMNQPAETRCFDAHQQHNDPFSLNQLLQDFYQSPDLH